MANGLSPNKAGRPAIGAKAGRTLVCLVMLSALALVGQTWAETAAARPAAAPAPAAPKRKVDADDAVVCKTVTYSGSRLGGSKACLTRGQWRQYEVDSQDATVASQLRADRGNPMGH